MHEAEKNIRNIRFIADKKKKIYSNFEWIDNDIGCIRFSHHWWNANTDKMGDMRRIMLFIFHFISRLVSGLMWNTFHVIALSIHTDKNIIRIIIIFVDSRHRYDEKCNNIIWLLCLSSTQLNSLKIKMAKKSKFVNFAIFITESTPNGITRKWQSKITHPNMIIHTRLDLNEIRWFDCYHIITARMWNIRCKVVSRIKVPLKHLELEVGKKKTIRSFRVKFH